MRDFMTLFFLCACILTISGCRPSVWKSDVCNPIEKNKVDISSNIQLPLFKHRDESLQLFHISDALNTMAVNRFALSHVCGTTTHQYADGAKDAAPKQVSAQSEKVHSIQSVSKKDKIMPGECVDLNTAQTAQLVTLPGIGQSRAESIVQARNKRPFKRRKDITRIKGISVKSYKKMEPYLCEI